MLQVIKAEEVRDGERCGLFRTMARAMDAIADLKHEPRPLLLWDRPMPVSEFPYAIVDRPAPTPTPAPGLDLDAVERAERAMTPGPWRHGSVERHHVFCSEGDRSLLCPEAGRVLLRMNEHFPHDSDAAGIVALRNAAPALIAEVRSLRVKLAEAKRLGMEALTIGDGHEAQCAATHTDDCTCRAGAIAAALEAL